MSARHAVVLYKSNNKNTSHCGNKLTHRLFLCFSTSLNKSVFLSNCQDKQCCQEKKTHMLLCSAAPNQSGTWGKTLAGAPSPPLKETVYISMYGMCTYIYVLEPSILHWVMSLCVVVLVHLLTIPSLLLSTYSVHATRPSPHLSAKTEFYSTAFSHILISGSHTFNDVFVKKKNQKTLYQLLSPRQQMTAPIGSASMPMPSACFYVLRYANDYFKRVLNAAA